jgi:hypothetical protein
MKRNRLIEQVQAYGIALATHQLHERGSGIDGEKKFVGMLKVDLLSHGETHARALVNDQLTAQVSFLLEAFHEELLRAAIEFPVDMADGLARVIKAMLGELNRKTVEGTLV